jgi:hypothetical protein
MSDAKHVVLIHGSWARGDSWAPARAAFEECGYTLNTPTLRHHELPLHEGAMKIAPLRSPRMICGTPQRLAISAGANVLAVSRMLGHENPQLTLKTYADLFDTDLDKVSDALNRARRKSVSKRGPQRVRQLRKATG